MEIPTEKPIHTIVLDTAPIIKDDPNLTSLRARSERLVTLPAVIDEIKDAATRARIQTSLLPFLELKTPSSTGLKFVTEFARRTGDLSVLSRVDLQLLALTYDLECERNGGDWRLRNTPGAETNHSTKPNVTSCPTRASGQGEPTAGDVDIPVETVKNIPQVPGPPREGIKAETPTTIEYSQAESEVDNTEQTSSPHSETQPNQEVDQSTEPATEVASLSVAMDQLQTSETSDGSESEGSDSEGWITPSNLKKKQAEAFNGGKKIEAEPKIMQVALLTADYAMQNVALQINLNLLSPTLMRIRFLKSFVLRCHACFNVVKDTSKQFCPRCGKPSLTRVSCSTENGMFRLHLKKNYQYNKRGDRYSIPKAVHGASNGRVKGGGKGGWGNELVLAEDQKEYVRAVADEKRQKERDFMDEDYLPGILTGDRSSSGGRIQVGAGRNVNSKKRK